MNWPGSLKAKINSAVSLKDKTTFKIGGRAEFYFQPSNKRELSIALSYAKKNRVRIFLLGAGSNILVCDNILKGLVIKLSSNCFKKIYFRNNSISVGSAFTISKLISEAAKKGFDGLEFLAGIPGTVGGAVFMNAGAWGKNIGNLVEDLEVMDYNGKIIKLKRSQIRFGYRRSNLAKLIILDVTLRLGNKDNKYIKEQIKSYLLKRSRTQDCSYPNAGCIFKNPPGESAGRLIDLCGLKGRSFGEASISKRHANFILNRKNAKAADVLKLMDIASSKVRNRFGVNLTPEIKIWK